MLRSVPASRIEWPTLALILGCTGVWGAATAFAGTLTLWVALPLIVLCLVLHSSLQHEVLHGHPLPSQWLSDALVFPALGIFVPYERFRVLHLAHHQDSSLTDPYDDPESNYLDPAVWARLPWMLRRLLLANNTLAGRIVLGPAVGLWCFYRCDLGRALAGDRAVWRAYALHLAGLAPVAIWLGTVGEVPLPAYLIAAYLALSVLRIRTFLEHRAHEAARGRSVIIEDRGPLAFLFLNNNLHAVHHGHPGLPWYSLPEFYRTRRERFLDMNHDYRYSSYGDVFRRYFLRRKDPVPHPLYPPIV